MTLRARTITVAAVTAAAAGLLASVPVAISAFDDPHTAFDAAPRPVPAGISYSGLDAYHPAGITFNALDAYHPAGITFNALD